MQPRAFRTPISLCLLALCVSACGPREDIADNPPKRGQWQIEAKLISATIDNVSIDDEETEMLGLNGINRPIETLGCTEPDISKAKKIHAMLPGKLGKTCTAKSFDGNKEQFTATLSCDTPEPIKDAFIRMEGRASEKEMTVRNAVSIGLMDDGGSTNRIDIVQRIIWTRTGDCG